MGQEIERKYLVNDNSWKKESGVLCRQGYLNSQKERVVRVRTIKDQGFLTIKGASVGATRLEFEYEIPFNEAIELLNLCEQPLIEKTRYHIKHEDLTWTVDEFSGENDGLIIAEVELLNEDQTINKPSWVGKEVTNDPRFYNSNLIKNPYTTW